MIHLVYSNRTEELLAALVESLRAQRSHAHPLDPVELVVPNRGMETYVRLGVAQALGVAANLRFRRLERFVAELVTELDPRLRVAGGTTLQGIVLGALLDDELLAQPELEPVRAYVQAGEEADGTDLRRVQLAARLGHLFEEYGYSRFDMLDLWRRGRLAHSGEHGRLEAWQRALWLALFDRNRSPTRWTSLHELFTGADAQRLTFPKRPVHVFGVSYVARLFQHVFATLGEKAELHLYSLNPCLEFWEDVPGGHELRQRIKLSHRSARVGAEALVSQEDPFALSGDEDNPALRLWGRPGRESVRLLNELTDCDFVARFVEPSDASSLLARLQHDILVRAPEPAAPAKDARWEDDKSLRVFACPGVRREVETVADEIWRLLREDDGRGSPWPLRLSDIAVIVHNAVRERYVPHIEAVFGEYHQIPYSVTDVPLASVSRVVTASLQLLDLPFGRFSRAELMRLMLHPAVIGRFDDVAPETWTSLADELGIVFGADHAEHAGTYIDKDILNWDQGLRRLALGAFMTGAKSGDERLFELGEDRYLVHEQGQGALDAAARFVLLARSLIADSRVVRGAELTLSQWSEVLRKLLASYIHASNAADERDRVRCLSALATLADMDTSGRMVSGRVATELAKDALNALQGGRGSYLAEGVVVSSFVPMRAIPFRVVFVLGLGEGLFPARAQLDALDLRAARRRAGDVGPAERDRYMFLEALLCARERLHLSYVARDELTGEPLEASSVIHELLYVLERGYLGEQGRERLIGQVPARRSSTTTVCPTATDEARALALGDALRQARGRGDAAEDLRAVHQAASPEAWAMLSRLLSVPQVPEPSRHPARRLADGLGLSATALRRFLECPMQGWARAMLGLSDEDDDDGIDCEDETLELGRPEEALLLRRAFVDAAREGLSAEELYDRLALRQELAGAIPTGVFGRVLRARHHGILRAWKFLIQEACHVGEHDVVRPGRIGIGRGLEGEVVDSLLDPLCIAVKVGTPNGAAEDISIQLGARTQALVQEGRTSLVLAARNPRVGGLEGKVKLYRDALRGFLDHVVLSATGSREPSAHKVLVCLAASEEDRALAEFTFAALTTDAARNYLTELTRDVVGQSHAYLLPCEAVFAAHLQGELGDGVSVAAAIQERVADSSKACSSRYGPVPHPERYQPPDPAEIGTLIARRFGLFFESLTRVEGA